MNELLEGCVYRLGSVVYISGYEGYILEGDMSDTDRTVIDLGCRRVLRLCCGKAYLILMNYNSIRFKEFSGEGNKLRDILSEMGITAKIKTGHSGYKRAWEHSICKGANCSMRGIFSKYGYALQERIWADCWEYDFRMCLFNPGWVKIGGVDTDWFCTPAWVLDDVLGKGTKLIRRALAEPVDISEEKYRRALKDAELDEKLFMGW